MLFTKSYNILFHHSTTFSFNVALLIGKKYFPSPSMFTVEQVFISGYNESSSISSMLYHISAFHSTTVHNWFSSPVECASLLGNPTIIFVCISVAEGSTGSPPCPLCAGNRQSYFQFAYEQLMGAI